MRLTYFFKKVVSSMAEKSGNGYVGKVKNQGTQFVQAPHQSTPQKKGTVKTGNDLRMGGSKK